MKLYHSAYTRSGRARWMLEEVGASYDITRLALFKGETRTPEYLAIHPHGAVPAFVDGDLTLIESSAIVMHLADKYPEARLAPPVGSAARADYYRWLVYVPATIDPALEIITAHTRFLPEEKRNPALVEEATRKVDKIAAVITAALGDRETIVGDTFTAADVVVGSALGWVAFLGMLEKYPVLAAYHKSLTERPAYARAYAD